MVFSQIRGDGTGIGNCLLLTPYCLIMQTQEVLGHCEERSDEAISDDKADCHALRARNDTVFTAFTLEILEGCGVNGQHGLHCKTAL
jgi:hypothetical protein